MKVKVSYATGATILYTNVLRYGRIGDKFVIIVSDGEPIKTPIEYILKVGRFI